MPYEHNAFDSFEMCYFQIEFTMNSQLEIALQTVQGFASIIPGIHFIGFE